MNDDFVILRSINRSEPGPKPPAGPKPGSTFTPAGKLPPKLPPPPPPETSKDP